MKSNASSTVGVLLLNLGGPDSLSAVKPFLLNLFSDREIIRLGPTFLQKPLAYLISSLRAKKTEDAYRSIGGKSPIYEITQAQAEALEESLNTPPNVQDRAPLYKVYVAMRYWHPLIETVIHKIINAGIQKLFLLSLYPQYSVTTTGSSLNKVEEVASAYPLEMAKADSWFDHPRYIKALIETIRKGIDSFGDKHREQRGQAGTVHVLFSAHSLPVKFIEEGDPYAQQIKMTVSEITKEIDIPWSLSYQSKSGPVKWLEPSTEKKIEELAEQGVKNLLVVPVSFVSDHIETLYEIDILYKNMAESLDMRLERTESLNTSPLFIEALRDIVLKGIREAGWGG